MSENPGKRISAVLGAITPPCIQSVVKQEGNNCCKWNFQPWQAENVAKQGGIAAGGIITTNTADNQSWGVGDQSPVTKKAVSHPSEYKKHG